MSDTCCIELYDANVWRTVERGVPNVAVYINRAMEQCARSYPGRRVRAVDDQGRTIDIWTS
jgi:hypothetical protein